MNISIIQHAGHIYIFQASDHDFLYQFRSPETAHKLVLAASRAKTYTHNQDVIAKHILQFTLRRERLLKLAQP